MEAQLCGLYIYRSSIKFLLITDLYYLNKYNKKGNRMLVWNGQINSGFLRKTDN